MDVRTKLKIVATKHIRQGGYSSFSFRDLATKTKIKSSTVHYYFPTKAHLVEEIVNEYRSSFIDRLNSKSKKSTTTFKKIAVLIRLYDENLANDLNCLCGVLAAELNLLSPKEKNTVMQFIIQIEKWLRSELKEYKPTNGLSVSELVHLIMSSLNGAIILDRTFTGKRRLSSVRSFVQQAIS